MEYTLPILSIDQVTHNVHCIQIAKPKDFVFTPGQATDFGISKSGWENERRPFTFTSLNNDQFLEFTIKSYTDHLGMTAEIAKLKVGDEVIISDPWGAINYQGEGYFIAGGAGITPFIAILRQLYLEKKLRNNKLFFSNKTALDIIYEEELKNMLGENIKLLLTQSEDKNYIAERINDKFISENISDFTKPIYICGPDAFTASISEIVIKHGANPQSVIFEK